jgi:hypothetical protein
VRVPDVLQDVFFIEKNNTKFPDTKGWAYAGSDNNPSSGPFTPDPAGTISLRLCVPYESGHQGLHFHRVRQAVNGGGRAVPARAYARIMILRSAVSAQARTA